MNMEDGAMALLWEYLEVIIWLVVLATTILAFTVSKRDAQAEQDMIARAETLQVERSFYAFNGKTVMGQDLIGLILKYKGSPAVYVDMNDGASIDTVKWDTLPIAGHFMDPRISADPYNLDVIENYVVTSKSYSSTVQRDANGAIISITALRE